VRGGKIKNCGGYQKQCKQHGNGENGHADREQAGKGIGLMGSSVSIQNVHTVEYGKQCDHDTENNQDQNSCVALSSN
jgi:hypothetical protein